MDSLARVSAVFLLIGLVWVTGIFAGGDDRRLSSQVRTQPKTNVGVGTRVGPESKGDPRLVEESPAAQEPSGVRGSPGGDERVLAVFREVEVGWRAGTPKPFEKYFRKGKVRLDLGEGGPRGGLFARSQAYYLIADYLKGTQTLDIDLVKTSDGTQGKTRPYALLERVFRDRNGVSRKEVVFISLALEDSLWAISELRAIPAK
jgi:hypothetical protein